MGSLAPFVGLFGTVVGITAAAWAVRRRQPWWGVGWFWFVALPLHWCLTAFHRLTGNYGLDIIIVSQAGAVSVTNPPRTSTPEIVELFAS